MSKRKKNKSFVLVTEDGDPDDQTKPEKIEVMFKGGLSWADKCSILEECTEEYDQKKASTESMSVRGLAQIRRAALSVMAMAPVDWNNITADSAEEVWDNHLGPLLFPVEHDPGTTGKAVSGDGKPGQVRKTDEEPETQETPG